MSQDNSWIVLSSNRSPTRWRVAAATVQSVRRATTSLYHLKDASPQPGCYSQVRGQGNRAELVAPCCQEAKLIELDTRRCVAPTCQSARWRRPVTSHTSCPTRESGADAKWVWALVLENLLGLE